MSLKGYDIKKMYEWPLVVQAIFIGTVAIVIFFLGYFFDILSLQKEKETDVATETDLKQQLTISYNRQIDAMNDAAQVPDLKKTLDKWQEKIITEAGFPALQDQLFKLGDQNHLKFNSFQPKPAMNDGEYTKVALNIEMMGTYDDIANFISQIANMNYLVQIGDFVMTKPTNIESGSGAPPAPETDVNNNTENNSASATPSLGAMNSDTLLRAIININVYRKTKLPS